MTERQIIFSSESVRAILEGRKTQSRRVIHSFGNQWHIKQPLGAWSLSEDPVRFEDIEKEIDAYYPWRPTREPGAGDWLWTIQTDVDDTACHVFKCPFGQPGDLLWVREAAWYDRVPLEHHPLEGVTRAFFVDTDEVRFSDGTGPGRSPFPLSDEILGLPGSSQIRRSPIFMPKWACRLRLRVTGVRVERLQAISEQDIWAEGCVDDEGDPTDNPDAFRPAWDSLNAKRGLGWDVNPWVWVLEFEQIDRQ
jgi:hypothetical protein